MLKGLGSSNPVSPPISLQFSAFSGENERNTRVCGASRLLKVTGEVDYQEDERRDF
jgi:hypothetical protein